MEDEPIVTPKEYIRHVAAARGVAPDDFNIPENVILIFNRENVRGFTTLLNAKLVNWLYSPLMFPIYVGDFSGCEVALLFSGWGASITVTLMEELIACGAKLLITTGSCGALQSYLNLGDIVIPTEAVRDEGVSYHYLPPEVKAVANNEVISALVRSTENHKVPFRAGSVWTIDAPYRELKSKVLMYKEQGLLAVDMETSAVLSLAIFKGIKAGCLLTVSDSLAKLVWEVGFNTPEFKQSEEKVPTIVIEALKILRSSNK